MPGVSGQGIDDRFLGLKGFVDGLRQPSMGVTLSLPAGVSANPKKLDHLLNRHFKLSIPEFRGNLKTGLNLDQKEIARLAWRIAQLANALLNAIHIPCYDPGYIVGIGALNEVGAYPVFIRNPIVGNMSPNIVQAAYAQSLEVISHFINQNYNCVDVEALSKEINENFIDPLRNAIAGSESSMSVTKAAFESDVPFVHLGASYYQLGWGRNRRLAHHSGTGADSSIGAQFTQDKFLTTLLFQGAGLPVPQNIKVDDLEAAQRASAQIGYPVVIKPSDSNRGEGVTVEVRDKDQVAKAYEHALATSKNILVEKQVEGICHRLLLAEGTLLYALRRDPISVFGDGRSTIGELVKHANDAEAHLIQHLRYKPYPKDDLAEQVLASRGLGWDCVPAKGAKIPLRPIESTEWGGTSLEVTEQVHAENLKLAIKASQLGGLHVAGVDIISKDIGVPWYENGAIVNEVNYLPMIGMRYSYHKTGLHKLMEQFFPDQGRIPIEMFVGDQQAFSAAQVRQAELNGQGQQCHLVTHEAVWGPDGIIPLALRGKGLFQRCQALLLSPDVGAIILVAQFDELLFTGLPVDRIDCLYIVNQAVRSIKDTSRIIDPEGFAQFISALNRYAVKRD